MKRRARLKADGTEANWALVAEGSRADGDNDALRRELLAQHPELAADEIRLDVICARDGSANLRIWKRRG